MINGKPNYAIENNHQKFGVAKQKITFAQQGKIYAPFSRKHRCPHMRFRVLAIIKCVQLRMWNVAMFSLIVAIFPNRCLESRFFAFCDKCIIKSSTHLHGFNFYKSSLSFVCSFKISNHLIPIINSFFFILLL